MTYDVIKAFNNNVVLVKQDSTQYILISKGIGFSKRPKDTIDFDAIKQEKKVFFTLDNYKTRAEIKKLGDNLNILDEITREIVRFADIELGIQNSNLYDALYDHIVFATERIRVGIPISNPFITEIMILCQNEFQIAKKAAVLLKKKLDIDIGVDEQCFIALHVYSAGDHKPISTTLNNLMIYPKIFELLVEKYNIKNDDTCYKNLLIALNNLVSIHKNSTENLMPNEVISAIKDSMNYYYEISMQITAMIEKELKISMNDEFIALLSIEILKITQTGLSG